MSWREREVRNDGRGRSPLWEPRRSPARSPQWEQRRRERERERRDRGRERSRSPRRRRSPRHSPDVPAPPSPPRISSVDMDLSSDSSDRERRPRRADRDRADRDRVDRDRVDRDRVDRDRERDRDRDRDRDRERDRDRDRDDHPDSLAVGASPGDWICKCGSYNFKRRQFCFKRKCQGNRSEGTIYNGDADKDNSSGITKRLLFRRLDALTTEEKILDALKERCSKAVLDTIAGITIGRETLTGASKCLAYINFNSIADSTAAYTELIGLSPRLQIDDREVLISYYNSPQKLPKPVADYSSYYSNYQSTEALSEADRVNAAAAVAQSAIASAQARQLSWTPVAAPAFVGTSAHNSKIKIPTGDGKTKYSAPDVRTFMYDDTSGYYYDAATGLYYDGTSQYFYNNQLNQYMYWDATNSTYIAATQAQQNTDQPKLPNPPDASNENTIKPPEEKKKKEKEDKVKVAKKIAKDMERWARTLNQKKENARTNTVMEQPMDTGPSKGSADIGFSVLGSGPILPSIRERVREPSPPPPTEDFLVKKTEAPVDSDDGIIDWVKLTCLLCKRKFPSADVLTKHKTMSDLHKSNLAEYMSKNELMPQTNGYRDRAAERRMKFGEDEPVVRRRFEPPEPSMMPFMPMPPPAVIDTIGGKMLQKMGWSEGRGLGKEEQGRIAPIEAEQRIGLAGLGQKKGIYTPTPGETYRDTVKKLMIARYKEVVGQEDGS